MGMTYEYYYAVIDLTDGMCMQVRDTSSYFNRADHIPIDEPNLDYICKYYYPIPQVAGDFNGSWYEDAEHTIPWNP